MSKPTKPKVVWSYSSKKMFEQCPEKYHRLRVVKDIKDDPGESAIYGTEMHLAAEEFVRDGKPIPEKFAFIRPSIEAVNAWPGTKYCEFKMGLREDLTACDFFAKDVWWRGVADLIVISPCGTKARTVDYKSSKSTKYADMEQLDLMAAAIFIHFPKVMTLHAALMFLVCDEMVPPKPKEYTFMFSRATFEKQRPIIQRIEAAMESGVWNRKEGPLCGWCPVKDCPHWFDGPARKRRK